MQVQDVINLLVKVPNEMCISKLPFRDKFP